MKGPFEVYVGECGVTVCDAQGEIVGVFPTIEHGLAIALEGIGTHDHHIHAVS